MPLGIYVQSWQIQRKLREVSSHGQVMLHRKIVHHAIFNEGNTNTTTVSWQPLLRKVKLPSTEFITLATVTSTDYLCWYARRIAISLRQALVRDGIYNNGQSNETTIARLVVVLKPLALVQKGVFNQGRGNTTNVAG